MDSLEVHPAACSRPREAEVEDESSLAVLGRDKTDLLSMYSLHLQCLCANGTFRRALLAKHASILELLSSFGASQNCCVSHAATIARVCLEVMWRPSSTIEAVGVE